MNPFVLKALVSLGLAGAGGVGGFLSGKKRGEGETKSVFEEYNKEENEALANDAFMQGVEYAMGKESNLKDIKILTLDKVASSAFNNEIEKIAKSKKNIIDLISKNKGKIGAITGGAAALTGLAALMHHSKKKLNKKLYGGQITPTGWKK